MNISIAIVWQECQYFDRKIPLANFVTTIYPWNKTSTTAEMTGIPADVLFMAKTEDMKVIIYYLKIRWKQDSRQHWPASLMLGK